MKTVVYGLGILAGLAIALVVAVLVAPSMIDWNDYRSDIAAEFEKATGRTLVVEGDLNLGVLPVPYLKAEDVRISDASGATKPDVITLRAVRVHLRFLPLLKGRIEIAGIELIRPVMELERFSDGGINWLLSPDGRTGFANVIRRSLLARTGIVIDYESIRLDRVEILDGILNYRDLRTQTDVSLREFSLDLRTDDPDGPVSVRASAMAGRTPLTVEARLGSDTARRGTEVDLRLGVAGTQLKVDGEVVNLSGRPRLRADVSWEGAGLADLISSFTGTSANGFVDGSFVLTASILMTDEEARVDDLMLDVNGFRAEGNARLGFQDGFRAAFSLQSGRVNLDRLAARESSSPESTGSDNAGAGTDRHAGRQDVWSVVTGVLPADATVDLEYSAEELLIGGSSLRSVSLAASLANGTLSLQQARALLPGESRIEMSGLVRLDKEITDYRGRLALRSANLRQLLTERDLDLSGVADDRLRRATVSADFSGVGSELRLSKIEADFDASRIRGAATVLLRDRLAFGANLSIDRLDVDAYWPPKHPEAGETGDDANDRSDMVDAKSSQTGSLAFLDAFDANLVVNASSLSFRETTIHGFRFSASLQNGRLTVGQASTRSLGGARVRLEGTLEDLGRDPTFTGTVIAAAGKAEGLARFLGLELPATVAGMGEMRLRLKGEGRLDRFAFDARFDLGDLKAAVEGNVFELQAEPRFDLAIESQHPDFTGIVALLSDLSGDADGIGSSGSVSLRIVAKGDFERLAVEAQMDLPGGGAQATGVVEAPWDSQQFAMDVTFQHDDIFALIGPFVGNVRPATSFLDQVSLSANVKRSGDAVAISSVSAEIGEISVVGEGYWKDQDPRPAIKLAVIGDVVPLSDILDTVISGSDANSNGSGQPAKTGGWLESWWSKEARDDDVLALADVEIEASAAALAYRELRLDDVRFTAKVRDGTLEFDKLVGRTLGGQVSASGRVIRAGTPIVEIDMSVDGANLTEALFGEGPFDLSSGSIDANLEVTTRGHTPADMVRTLSGKGRLAVKDGVVRGFDLKSFGGHASTPGDPADAIERMKSVMSHGSTDVSELDTEFRIADGVLELERMRMTGNAGSVSVDGHIDLDEEKLDLQALFVPKGEQGLPPFQVSLTGSVDEPDRRFEMSEVRTWLLGRNIREQSRVLAPSPVPADPLYPSAPEPSSAEETQAEAPSPDSGGVADKRAETPAGRGGADDPGEDHTAESAVPPPPASESEISPETLVDELIRDLR